VGTSSSVLPLLNEQIEALASAPLGLHVEVKPAPCRVLVSPRKNLPHVVSTLEPVLVGCPIAVHEIHPIHGDLVLRLYVPRVDLLRTQSRRVHTEQAKRGPIAGTRHQQCECSRGFTAVFDAETGAVSALLLDGGYLTELRTGAAGALTIDLLAPSTVNTMAFIGTGGQIRFQIEGALTVRSPREITVLGRQLDRAQDVARWASERFGIAAEAVMLGAEPIDADVIVTATAATSPVLQLAQVRPDVHITAVGADSPGKRELSNQLLAAATLIAVDSIEQSETLGELQTDATHVKPHTIGELIEAGYQRRPLELTIADLSGVGAQDAGIAEVAVRALK
jgi:ornithine cyclodeaminase/alanine dehydrogenase-like protein (mu-crystallin family)